MRRHLSAGLVLATLMLPPVGSGANGRATELHLATWNLEWLVSPATALASRLSCDDGTRATLPCDVARTLARDSADFARLRAYARALDADVIALQEVEDVATAQRVFRGYDICLSRSPGVQQVGFAVRAGLAHRCAGSLASLSLDGRGRAGALLHLLPGTPDEVILLAVHLKSGCATAPLEQGPACVILDAQADALAAWIAARSREHGRFVVLGDFNRAGPRDGDPFWQRLHAAANGALFNAAAHTVFRNCYLGQPFSQYIDHILLGPALGRSVVPGSFRKRGYASRDALRYRLSDHCPVGIRLRLGRYI